MKRFIKLFAALLFLAVMVGCEGVDAPRKYTIATQKGMYIGQWGYYQPYYNIYDHKDKKWYGVESLQGVTPEYGYEYVVVGKLTTAEEYGDMGIADAVSDFVVQQVISKEEKTSTLPERESKSAEAYNNYFGNEYLVASQHSQSFSPTTGEKKYYLNVCDLKTNEWYLVAKQTNQNQFVAGKEYIVRGKLYTEQDFKELEQFGYHGDTTEPQLQVEYILSQEEKTTTLPED